MPPHHHMPQITGEQIRDLRRRQGMSHLSFAQDVGMPVWLVEILEQEQPNKQDPLSQLIPDTMRERFYRLLLNEYGQPEEWLSVEPCDPDNEPLREEDEVMLYLPITISSQMVTEWLNMILLLHDNSLSSADIRDGCERYLVANLIQLHQMYSKA